MKRLILPSCLAAITGIVFLSLDDRAQQLEIRMQVAAASDSASYASFQASLLELNIDSEFKMLRTVAFEQDFCSERVTADSVNASKEHRRLERKLVLEQQGAKRRADLLAAFLDGLQKTISVCQAELNQLNMEGKIRADSTAFHDVDAAAQLLPVLKIRADLLKKTWAEYEQGMPLPKTI